MLFGVGFQSYFPYYNVYSEQTMRDMRQVKIKDFKSNETIK